MIDDHGAFRTANASAERILGLPLAELMKRSLDDPSWNAIYEDGRPFPAQAYPAAVTLRTGQSCSGVIMGVYKPDGALCWLDINSRPLRVKGQAIPSAVVVSFSDITKRKRAEERLTAQYSVTRVLAESRTWEEAVPKIIQAVGENLEWDCGVFWRVDRVGGALRCIDQWHLLYHPRIVHDRDVASVLNRRRIAGRNRAGGKPAWVTMSE